VSPITEKYNINLLNLSEPVTTKLTQATILPILKWKNIKEFQFLLRKNLKVLLKKYICIKLTSAYLFVAKTNF